MLAYEIDPRYSIFAKSSRACTYVRTPREKQLTKPYPAIDIIMRVKRIRTLSMPYENEEREREREREKERERQRR